MQLDNFASAFVDLSIKQPYYCGGVQGGKSKNYLEWNPHKANKGNTRTQRRWRVGKAGSQEDWVKIVDTREKVMVKLKNKGVVLDNPITPIDGLE